MPFKSPGNTLESLFFGEKNLSYLQKSLLRQGSGFCREPARNSGFGRQNLCGNRGNSGFITGSVILLRRKIAQCNGKTSCQEPFVGGDGLIAISRYLYYSGRY